MIPVNIRGIAGYGMVTRNMPNPLELGNIIRIDGKRYEVIQADNENPQNITVKIEV